MPRQSSLKPYADEPPVGEEFPDLTDELADIVAEAMDATIAEHGLEDLVSEGDTLVSEALDYARSRAAELVTAIDETTQERLQQMIEDAVSKDLSPAELADNIGRSFAFSEERADMIARTELTDAWNSGVISTLKDAGEEYVYATDGDGCEVCAAVKDDPIWTIEEADGDESEHPNCFPSGILVSAPNRQLGYSRAYEGELVVLRTASDQLLPSTPNHPILTDRGWRAAKLIRQGDHVIRSTDHAALFAAGGADEYQRPAPIEEVARSPRMEGSRVRVQRSPSRSDDFHGDGEGSKVYVERTLGLLRDSQQPATQKKHAKAPFRRRLVTPVPFLPPCSAGEILRRALHPAHGLVRRLRPGFSRSPRHLCPLHAARFRVRALNPETPEPQSRRRPINAVAARDLFLRQLLSKVETAQRHIRGAVPERVAGPVNRFRDRLSIQAEALPNLLDGLTGLVAAEKIVSVGTCSFRGHVFNLQTAGNWYVAGDYIRKNCEREFRPLTPDEADEMAQEDAADAREGFSARLARLEQRFYSEDEPRDERGRWTSGGDAEPKLSDRAQRALASYKPSTAEKQRVASESERKVAEILRGQQTDDNSPTDITLTTGGRFQGVEVKTLVDNKNDKITMHPESRERKEAWAMENHAALHTVVVDSRGQPPRIYYHEGVGSFRLAGMALVRDAAHLRSLVAGGK